MIKEIEITAVEQHIFESKNDLLVHCLDSYAQQSGLWSENLLSTTNKVSHIVTNLYFSFSIEKTQNSQ